MACALAGGRATAAPVSNRRTTPVSNRRTTPRVRQIESETGAVLVTRGRYFADKSKAGSSEKDKPLYLYVTAPSKAVLDAGIRKIVEHIEQVDGRAGVAHLLAIRPTLAAALPFAYVEGIRDASTPAFQVAAPSAAGGVGSAGENRGGAVRPCVGSQPRQHGTPRRSLKPPSFPSLAF